MVGRFLDQVELSQSLPILWIIDFQGHSFQEFPSQEFNSQKIVPRIGKSYIGEMPESSILRPRGSQTKTLQEILSCRTDGYLITYLLFCHESYLPTLTCCSSIECGTQVTHARSCHFIRRNILRRSFLEPHIVKVHDSAFVV